MRKFIYGVLFLLSCLGTSHAISVDELSDKLYLSQHWISYTTSFDIKTKKNKLGTLYRRVLSLMLTYDFYDNSGHLISTSHARFFSLGAHFDVYDDKNSLLGSVEEQFFTFLPSFIIYSNTSQKLARAEMNFWGTEFSIYEAESDKLIAMMSRSFFRLKNDWTIDFKNKALLQSKNIDIGLFMTVVAFQADSEYWAQQQQNNNSYLYSSASSHANATNACEEEVAIKKSIQEKIADTIKDENLKDAELMNTIQLEILAVELERDYKNQMNLSSEPHDSVDKVNAFVDFCLTRIKSDKINPEEKKAILYLLQERVGTEQPDVLSLNR